MYSPARRSGADAFRDAVLVEHHRRTGERELALA